VLTSVAQAETARIKDEKPGTKHKSAVKQASAAYRVRSCVVALLSSSGSGSLVSWMTDAMSCAS
jgi:hypothetical protein